MAFFIDLVETDSLKATDDGFEIKVRLLWYRSLPLSCVEQVSLAVDGKAIDPQDVFVDIGDALYRSDQLEELVHRVWFVQDAARLVVHRPGAVVRGQQVTIDAEVVLRAPYIMVGPGKFLTMPTKQTVSQVAA